MKIREVVLCSFLQERKIPTKKVLGYNQKIQDESEWMCSYSLENKMFRMYIIFKDFFFFFLSFCLFAISWAASAAHGDSQAKGWIRAVAADLHQNHSNAESELHLQPTPQLTAMLDP